MDDKSFIGQSSLSLFENAQQRSRHWEYFFEKYSRTDTKNNLSFTIYELSDDMFNLDQAEHYTNRAVLINPSPYELKITDQIENKLQSRLNRYILIREKTKQLVMPECYEIIHKVVKKEVRRLKKFGLSTEDIEKYFCLCVTPKEGVQDYIERELQSNIKMLVINQFKTLEEPLEYKMWNMKLIAEFEHLTEVLPEEDVIKYMTYVLRH